MTAIPSYFTDFLQDVGLTKPLREACQEKHQTLRRLLKEDGKLSGIIVDVFLQGSYARGTATRPIKPNSEREHVDVDLVVVTTLDPDVNSPDHVVSMLKPFLDRCFPRHWSVNDRSIKITFDDTPVTLDLVVTAAPSMAVQDVLVKSVEGAGAGRLLTLSERRLEDPPTLLTLHESAHRIAKAMGVEADWRENPLLIPDRLVKQWVPTHPIRQSEWTIQKNASANGHYLGVVKSVKWWRRRNNDPEYPKGYPLEHLIGVVCPNGVSSVAEGLTLSLEAIIDNYRALVQLGLKPQLPDHGVPENDVFRRVTPVDFARFYRLVEEAAIQARRALDSATVAASAAAWRELLGEEFPEPPGGGFTARSAPSTIASRGRFGRQRLG